MERWDADDSDKIVVGRRMRTGRRRLARSPAARILTIVSVVLVVGLGIGGLFWLTRPTGLSTLPNPAVVAPGGFRASIGDHNTITVGLEVRNTADEPLTLTAARIVAPPGLSLVAVSIVPPGEGNEGFSLDGDLPAMAPVELGVDATNRNAIVAARFKVNCDALSPLDTAASEEIFVTIKFDDQTREEELTPPVVGDIPWLTSSAHRSCDDPVPTGSAEPPLPPLPGPEPPGASPTGG